MALALALERLGIGRGAKVLLPAYHCTALVEPVVRAGAVPVFYRVRRDLSIDLADVAVRADGARALLAVHYFGFPQEMATLRRFCDARGLLLIEDCAHAFFGLFGGRPVGTTGDVAIASSWKFFPVQEGGCLVARDPGGRLRRPGMKYEAKSMLNAFERAWAAGRLPMVRALLAPLFGLKNLLRDLGKRRAGAAPAPSGEVPTGSPEFDESWRGRRASWFTRFVLAAADQARIASHRRRNYALLLDGFRGLPHTTILFPSLPEGVVPYVFPLLVEDDRVFPALKRRGVPIVRFGEFLWERVDDPVAAEYSRKVLQFPCHQELTRRELDWIVAEVRDAVRKGVPR
jgi:dTDP-4-amino-4,6-dideoxygalactose transaminase